MGGNKKGKADVTQRPKIETNPWKLAGIGDTAGLAKLVEHEKEPFDITEKDEYGSEAIIWAARNGFPDTLKYLVEHGADINSAGFGGLRPLHHACNQLREGVLKLLIELGADMDATDNNGSTALHYAAERGVLEPLDMLLAAGSTATAENKSKASALHKAANDGHLSIVQRLISVGCDINAQDGKGNSPLHIAAMNRFRPMIVWLVANGANTRQKNKASKTAAMLAGPYATLIEIEDSEAKEE